MRLILISGLCRTALSGVLFRKYGWGGQVGGEMYGRGKGNNSHLFWAVTRRVIDARNKGNGMLERGRVHGCVHGCSRVHKKIKSILQSVHAVTSVYTGVCWCVLVCVFDQSVEKCTS